MQALHDIEGQGPTLGPPKTESAVGIVPVAASIAVRLTARRVTYRFTTDNRIVLLTTFRKQRNNERAEITRARKIAEECARLNP